jgi:hypothetical protein
MLLSKPYPSKGTARSAAIEQAEKSGFRKFVLLIDLVNRVYHFADQEDEDSKLIPFARYEHVKGKWHDKTMLGKAVSKGGKVVRQ